MRLKVFLLCLLVSLGSIAQGNYTKTKQNPDGTITCLEYMSCFSCQGKNVCYSCKGTGGKMLGSGAYARYIRCFSCKGSGTCGRCYGAGSTLVGRYITISDTDKNPNRTKIPNGYMETYGDSNGRTQISYKKCSWCSGLNTCKACKGTGSINLGTYTYPRYETCHSCFGKGNCNSCDNNGMVKTVVTTDYNSGQQYYVNETRGYVSQGNIYNNENSYSSSSSDVDSKVGCGQCKGEGWYCKYRRTYGSDGKWCKYCQEMVPGGIHFRTRCDICKGKGSY